MSILLFTEDQSHQSIEALKSLDSILQNDVPKDGNMVGASIKTAISMQLILNELVQFKDNTDMANKVLDNLFETLHLYKEKIFTQLKGNPMLNFLEQHAAAAVEFLEAGTNTAKMAILSEEDKAKTLLLSGITLIGKVASDVVDPALRDNLLNDVKTHILSKIADAAAPVVNVLETLDTIPAEVTIPEFAALAVDSGVEAPVGEETMQPETTPVQ